MFNSGMGGYSLADVAAATGNGRNGDGWGDNSTWWVIVLFLFAFGGFGRGFNGEGYGALTRADLCQDMNFQGIENGIRGIQQGLCDGFYNQNTTMLQGFNGLQNTIGSEFRGVDNAICNLGYNVQQGFNTSNITAMQNANAIQSQLSQCCCENRAAIADVKYQMATDTCAVQNSIQNQTRDIIDNTNANTRSILDFLVQDKISTLETENQSLRLAASQQQQNTYLVNALRPAPVPAFNVPAPYSFTNCGCNNSGCGCGCVNNY